MAASTPYPAGGAWRSGQAEDEQAAVVRAPPWAAGHGPASDLRPAYSDQKGEEAAVCVLGING